MPSQSSSDYELVRVSKVMVERLLAQDPQPVVLVGLERYDDETIELVFRTPDDPCPHGQGDKCCGGDCLA